MQWAFDLGSNQAVREHARPILAQLQAGRMPCYGAWPEAQVSLFQRWIESGMRPLNPREAALEEAAFGLVGGEDQRLLEGGAG